MIVIELTGTLVNIHSTKSLSVFSIGNSAKETKKSSLMTCEQNVLHFLQNVRHLLLYLPKINNKI